MTRIVQGIASLKLTCVGFAMLGAALALGEFGVALPVWVLPALLGALALNLAAALAVDSRLRRTAALFVFHVALFCVIGLAAIGRLTYFKGAAEVLEGNPFGADDLIKREVGWLAQADLSAIQFVQGPFTVDYAPGLRRGATRNTVFVRQGEQWIEQTVGDHRPLVIAGHRFYTTFNKGFAAILTWQPDAGAAVQGAVHMPSFPLFDWKQDNRWQAPNGVDVRFWLRPSQPAPEDRAWQLVSSEAAGVLVVNVNDQRVELSAGESASLPGGRLRFEGVRGWMGYQIHYDPTLAPLFAAAVIAALSLVAHLIGTPGGLRRSREQPRRATVMKEAM